MGRKKTPEVDAQATRERIIATAERWFRGVGYSKTTVADLAAELNMSPSNIYRYFPTKAHINREICDRLMRGIESRCAAAIDPAKSVPERIKSFVLAYHVAIRETIFNGNKLYDMVSRAVEEHWPIIHGHGERIREVLAALLAQGACVGEFRNIDTYRMARAMQDALVVFIYPQLLEHLANEFNDGDRKDSLEEQLLFLLDAFFHGICVGDRSKSSRESGNGGCHACMQ